MFRQLSAEVSSETGMRKAIPTATALATAKITEQAAVCAHIRSRGNTFGQRLTSIPLAPRPIIAS
jgi:hypothetical protein